LVIDNFIIFSDPHYQKNIAKSKLTNSGLTSWLSTQLQITEEIFNYARENKVKTIIVNGDIFHDKTRISVDVYNLVWDLYKKLSTEFDIIFNTGNHDIYTLNKESALKPFSDIVTVITEPTNFKSEKVYLRIIPFGQVENNLGLEESSDKYTNILLTHEDISGLIYGDDQFESSTPLKYQIFGDWDIVFNGHIHDPQVLNNIHNIGAPMYHNWGESKRKKGFYHYNNNDLRFIYTNCPQFIEYDSIEEFRNNITDDSLNDNFHRIKVFPSEAGNEIFKDYNIVPQICKSEKREIKLKDNMSNEDELKEYINIVDDKGLDKNKLLETGMKLMEDKL
jgi:DNA repair exonuclease SbcCD nuclease subunit